MKPLRTLRYGKMQVNINDCNRVLGIAAADELAEILRSAIAAQGDASIIVSTGNSQLSFLEALCAKQDIAWDRVSVFHLDEYLGISEQHPASFRRYVREHFTAVVRPRVFYGIQGDVEDIEAELTRYESLLLEHQPVACVIGVGENGHLAFNDPPADFYTDKTIHVVTLDETTCLQQVGEGHFAALSDVPTQAITLTVPALLKPARVLAVVPEARKAVAVKAALEGPVTPDCPASILRTQRHVTMYLDRDSASLLEPAIE